MKKLILLSLVMLSILLSGCYSEKKIEVQKISTFSYQLEGKGDKWLVDNYKVIKTTNKIKRTSARLVYRGNNKEIDQSTFFSFQIFEDNKVVYSNIQSSQGGPVSILTNIDDLGAIENEITEFDKKISRSNIENTKIKLTWKDNKGKTNVETINLSII
jgi:outer membrane murein-binding lipoprotein Lpp